MKKDSSAPDKLHSIKEEWKSIATSELRLLAEKESKRLIWKIDVSLITNQFDRSQFLMEEEKYDCLNYIIKQYSYFNDFLI